MTVGIRKLALTLHISFSVGWFGAVAGFLILSIAGLANQNANIVHAVYISMDLIGRFVIVPMSLIALVTGIVLALGTKWGLFRYYWVLTKFLLTLFSVIVLLLHQFTAVEAAAKRVSEIAPETLPELGRLGIQLVADAGIALLVLIFITILSVFKPWGRTSYKLYKVEEKSNIASSTNNSRFPLSLKVFLVTIGLLLIGFIIIHLAKGGLGNHH